MSTDTDLFTLNGELPSVSLTQGGLRLSNQMHITMQLRLTSTRRIPVRGCATCATTSDAAPGRRARLYSGSMLFDVREELARFLRSPRFLQGIALPWNPRFVVGVRCDVVSDHPLALRGLQRLVQHCLVVIARLGATARISSAS